MSNNSRKDRKICAICGKSIFEDEQFTFCIKTKYDKNICLNCASQIDELYGRVELQFDYDYDDEDDEDEEEVDDKSYHNFEKSETLPSRNQVVTEVSKVIKGQDEAIYKLVSIIYRNRESSNECLKFHPLVVGKSGHGKTEIIKQICKELKIPYVLENAKDFSEAGYVGRNVIEIFKDLYDASGSNIKKAEKGVIIIDEVDKLKESKGGEKDVSGAGVVNSFLGYIGGDSVPIIDNLDSKIGQLNLANVTFIFMGAFDENNTSDSLIKIRDKRMDNVTHMGFETKSVVNDKITKDKVFVPSDFITYGFSRQFIGRVTIIELNDLTFANYKDIMLNSKNSIYRGFEKEFKLHGVKMNCSETLQDRIVTAAMKKKIGARGLRYVCEEVFLPALQKVEFSEDGKYKEVTFNDDAVNNSSNYILV